ncbi:MAG: hypothetical protein DWQ05_10870 [Calditrichaeota bacterium]|nr:MAG: hypothetical protein DWQ05_10870 [Calditrichota bacterium]
MFSQIKIIRPVVYFKLTVKLGLSNTFSQNLHFDLNCLKIITYLKITTYFQHEFTGITECEYGI